MQCIHGVRHCMVLEFKLSLWFASILTYRLCFRELVSFHNFAKEFVSDFLLCTIRDAVKNPSALLLHRLHILIDALVSLLYVSAWA